MATKEQILDSLSKLDKEDKEHWTGNGLPRISVLNLESVTRDEITDAAPKFSRENLDLPSETEEDDDLFGDDNEDEKDIEDEKVKKKDTKKNEKAEPKENKSQEEKLLKEVEKAEEKLHKAEKDVKVARENYDNYITEHKVTPGKTNQKDIMDYINRQVKSRAQKGGSNLVRRERQPRPLINK